SVALGQLQLALGDNDTAADAFAVLVDQVEQDGIENPWRRRFLPDAVEALVQVGRLEQADRLTVALEKRATTLGWPAATVAAGRCQALVQAARGEVKAALEGLDESLAEVGHVPEPLQLARTLIVRGQLERRRRDKRNAASSLEQAAEICDRIGATLWGQRARAELERLGQLTDPDELTPTEMQVARLAVTGLSNREIATAAFISQKTVEANMTRIYRKLGIHSRVELATWLAERDRAGEASDVEGHLLLRVAGGV